MAGNYVVSGSIATVQVVDPTTTVDVLRITFRTIPSGIIARANAPYRNIGGFTTADADTAASIFIEPLALGIERAMGLGYVAGMVATEDTDANGLLIDYMDVTVSYQPPAAGQVQTLEAVARIPTNAFAGEDVFFGPLVLDVLNATYAGLVKLAGE